MRFRGTVLVYNSTSMTSVQLYYSLHFALLYLFLKLVHWYTSLLHCTRLNTSDTVLLILQLHYSYVVQSTAFDVSLYASSSSNTDSNHILPTRLYSLLHLTQLSIGQTLLVWCVCPIKIIFLKSNPSLSTLCFTFLTPTRTLLVKTIF